MPVDDHKIVKLDGDLVHRLQSQVTIDSFGTAIKELVQNSIDADASEIIVNVDVTRLSAVVSDNGFGMSPGNLQNVGQRFFTSKLTSSHDLKEISTFGFRGEALHSLNSIAKLTVISKHKSCTSSFRLNNSGLQNKSEIFNFEKLPPDNFFHFDVIKTHGTIVCFSGLFHNIPVRRDHILKNPAHVLIEEVKGAIFQSLIKNPSIHVVVYQIDHVTKELFKLFEVSDVRDKYAGLFKSVFGNNSLPHYDTIHSAFKDFEVSGFIGGLQSRRYQFIFINNRLFSIPGEDLKELNKLFKKLDNNKDSPKKSPKKSTTVGNPYYQFHTFLVNITCSTFGEDFLQDPSKSIFHTKNWETILRLIKKIFVSYVESQGLDIDLPCTIVDKTPSPKKQRVISGPYSPSLARFSLNTHSKVGYFREPEIRSIMHVDKNTITSPRKDEIPISRSCKFTDENNFDIYLPSFELDELSISKQDFKMGNYRVIRQIDKKFILLKMKVNQSSNLIIVDQHACDERIKVETLFQDFINEVLDPNINVSIGLENAIKLDIGHHDRTLFEQYKPNFSLYGIMYHEENNSILVTHLPGLLLEKVKEDGKFLESCLLQHIYDLNNNIKSTKVNEDWFLNIANLPRVIIELINSKSCRSSIMFGEQLELEQMETMISKLSNCRFPFQCAHGRPSIVPLVNLSNSFIEK